MSACRTHLPPPSQAGPQDHYLRYQQSLGVPRAALLRVGAASGRQEPEAMRIPAAQRAVSHRDEQAFQTWKRRNQSCIHKSLLAYIGHERTLDFDH